MAMLVSDKIQRPETMFAVSASIFSAVHEHRVTFAG